jgi:dTDP-4-dehydrorhamnose 3,5-epimerase
MRFTPLPEVDGVHLVELTPFSDERGSFSRAFAAEEFEAHGLEPAVVHANLSANRAAGTLRGLHRTLPPHAEAKFVRVVRGSIVDVAVDVRPGSPTYLQSVMVELTADAGNALYLPPYVAHAFQTLEDDTDVLYLCSSGYVPGAEQGFRHDDPAFGLTWPLPVSAISAKDASWPLFDEAAAAAAVATA